VHVQILRWQHKRPHHDEPDTPAAAGQATAADVQLRQHAVADRDASRGNHQAERDQHHQQEQRAIQQEQQGSQQQQQERQERQQELRAVASDVRNNNRRRLQLLLTLDSSDQQPAALAFLQALYGVKEVPQLLLELTQDQQLQVALLADMWQVPQLTSAAVSGLNCYLKAHRRLSDEATQQLLALQAVPDFLQALVEPVLICRFGALEAVWSDPAQAEALLEVPLAVMCVYLSLGGLQVRCLRLNKHVCVCITYPVYMSRHSVVHMCPCTCTLPAQSQCHLWCLKQV
jgi:hypothetical protein